MALVALSDWGPRNCCLVALPDAATAEEAPMREKLAAIRDTMIVLSLQLVFRTVMLLRRWNY